MKNFLKKYRLTFAYCLTVFICKNYFGGMLALGMFFGAFLTLNPLCCGVVCIANALLYGWENCLTGAVAVVVVLVFFYLHKLIHKRITRLLYLLYVCSACVFYCVYNTADYFVLFDKLLDCTLAVGLSFVMTGVVRIAKRGFGYKVSVDDKVALAIWGVIVSYCLSQTTVFGCVLVEVVAPAVVLFAVCSLGGNTAFCIATAIGVGNLLFTGSFDYIGFLMFATCFAVLFSQLNKYVSAVSFLVCDVLAKCIWLVDAVSVKAFLPVTIGCIVFVLVPEKVLGYVSARGGTSAERLTATTILNKLRTNTAKRLFRLSEVFLEMKSTFLGMANEEIVEKDVGKAIANQVCDAVCYDCKQRTDCWRTNLQRTERSFTEVATCALSKGKCTIIDAPQSLAVSCTRLPVVLAEANTLALRQAGKKARVQSSNQSKMLIGEEMGGVSTVLARLAGEMKGKVIFDCQTEKDISESLAFHNVKCADTVIIDDGNYVQIICNISQDTYQETAVSQIVSKCVKQEVVVARVEETQAEGWLNVFLQKKPLFDVTIGVRSVTKHGGSVSGDTHSFVKTDNGKCIVTVCDGMGSGDVAEKMSTTAISLVENFYRAGFDNDVILSCVNKLLAKSGNEVFCAVDICALDMNSGLADFIKLGATNGLLRVSNVVEVISGASLPLGVLEEMKPSVTKKALSSGDDVVLLSDGVVDCFSDINLLASVFAEARFTNPQSVADFIMEKALATCRGKNADDMTVVVAHLT